jgi:hypothetical protein
MNIFKIFDLRFYTDFENFSVFGLEFQFRKDPFARFITDFSLVGFNFSLSIIDYKGKEKFYKELDELDDLIAEFLEEEFEKTTKPKKKTAKKSVKKVAKKKSSK